MWPLDGLPQRLSISRLQKMGEVITMKSNAKIIGIVIFVILFGGIGAAKALGFWQTSSSKVPATYKTGEFTGQYNPADIRGSYSFGDITRAFKVPIEDLATAFAVNTIDPAEFLVKDLGVMYAELVAQGMVIESDSVRYFVALYNGLPYTPVEETYFPSPAVDILKARGNLTPEQILFLDNRTADISNVTLQAVIPGAEEVEEVEEVEDPTDTTIKGKTTFKETLDWGVPKEAIEEIIGGKLPTTGTVIRDYCEQKGIEFSTVKIELQTKVPK